MRVRKEDYNKLLKQRKSANKKQHGRSSLDVDTESAIFAKEFVDRGLPAPVREYMFNAPETKHRLDYAWPGAKVAVERDGGIFTGGAHGSITGRIRDRIKSNLLAKQGWTVFRCIPSVIGKSRKDTQIDTTAIEMLSVKFIDQVAEILRQRL
jgi:hypothetical protein